MVVKKPTSSRIFDNLNIRYDLEFLREHGFHSSENNLIWNKIYKGKSEEIKVSIVTHNNLIMLTTTSYGYYAYPKSEIIKLNFEQNFIEQLYEIYDKYLYSLKK